MNPSQMNISQLQIELGNRGLSKGGRKCDLQRRLQQHLNTSAGNEEGTEQENGSQPSHQRQQERPPNLEMNSMTAINARTGEWKNIKVDEFYTLESIQRKICDVLELSSSHNDTEIRVFFGAPIGLGKVLKDTPSSNTILYWVTRKFGATVQTLNGGNRQLPLHVTCQTTVQEVKDMIRGAGELFNLQEGAELRLLCAGKQLNEDQKTLNDYGILADCHMTLMIR